jgi:hypothetical protein
MRTHLLLVSILVSACSGGPDEVLTCDEALETLSSCTSTDQAECADDSAAAQRVAQGECAGSGGGKADWFGNRVWGESCTWNWQCQGDTRHSCNQGTCYLRAGEGNACDRRDDRDCSEGLKCADDLAVPTAPAGVCKATRAPQRPALYAETLRPNELQEFQEHAFDIMAIQMRNAVQKKNGDEQVRRTFHAKRHACVVGDFQVLAAPADLATGPVFAQPKTFPAWVRFSNGTLVMGPDNSGKIQGLAVKLMGVPGPKLLEESRNAITQDFLMVNLKANAVANANEFLELTKAQDKGTAATAHYLLTHPRVALRVVEVATKSIKSVRTESYWAANAYKHGSIAVKYSAAPCAGTPAPAAITGDNYLRAELKPQLAAGTVCFDFFAQRQIDSVAQSVEDGTSVWDPAMSPPVKIARLTIPRTALDTAAVNATEATCDSLSFNPWNSAPEYRPLGHMNRSRKFAYEASTKMRHAAPEPTTIPGR